MGRMVDTRGDLEEVTDLRLPWINITYVTTIIGPHLLLGVAGGSLEVGMNFGETLPRGILRCYPDYAGLASGHGEK